MMNDKRKNHYTLPNRQLARIFNFSAQDLAANRAGFMSRAQEWGIPLWIRRVFGNIGIGISAKAARRPTVAHICGRVKLDYVQRQTHSHFHTDIREYHYLLIADMRFLLTATQHRAIGEGMTYRVYFMPQSKHILSLERSISGCNESSI
ncbi:MAG: hypothetical protein Q9P44_09380 [Anaerolineae bacterium]|nr:hypothetical protein [Anaerolineae bacterium]